MKWVAIIVFIILFLLPAKLTAPASVDRAFADDFNCLVWVISDESRGEPVKGSRAVYEVILNRMRVRGLTACEVVKEPHQFSGYHKGMKMKWNNEDLTRYQEVVSMENIVADAQYFHATYVKPKWRLKMARIVKIGRHIFYRVKEKKNDNSN